MIKKIISLSKIIFLIIFSAIILSLKNIFILSIGFLLLTVTLILIQPKQLVFTRLKALIPVGLLIIIFQLIFNRSLSLINRFSFAYLVFIKIVIVSAVVLLFTSITSSTEIIDVFYFLPKKIKLLLTMTFYFIPAILDESQKIANVQKSRGLNSFIFNPLPLIIPLIHRVFKRSETLALTISSRGYEE